MGGSGWAGQDAWAGAARVESQTATDAVGLEVQRIYGAHQTRAVEQHCRTSGIRCIEQKPNKQSAWLAAEQTRYVQKRAGHTQSEEEVLTNYLIKEFLALARFLQSCALKPCSNAACPWAQDLATAALLFACTKYRSSLSRFKGYQIRHLPWNRAQCQLESTPFISTGLVATYKYFNCFVVCYLNRFSSERLNIVLTSDCACHFECCHSHILAEDVRVFY